MPSSSTPSRVERPDTALSLYHLLDPEVLANPYPLFARLRREDPVHWDPFLHAWIVTRYSEVLEVLHTFSADRTPTPEQLSAMGLAQLNPIAQVMVRQMLFMDAPAHTRLRGLASKAFTPARVEQLRAHIREIVDRLLDGIEPRGGMDVIADFAEPLPAIVTAELMGMPTRDWQKLKEWSANFAEMLGNFQHNPEHAPRMLRTVEEMTGYFRQTVRDIAAHPREGLIHSLITAEIDGDRLTEEEVIANAIVTIVGGQETTTNLIGNGLLTLLRNPAEMERLRADLTLIPSAVEEMLRYESPSQHTARLAPGDCELGGKSIQKRQAVIAVMAAANRDPERFPEPDRFDITRSDNRHLAFGYAAHFCFGAPLARAEGQIAFERMLGRFPKIRLEPQKLEWRTNLGLRGLVSLQVGFGEAVRNPARAASSAQRSENEPASAIEHAGADDGRQDAQKDSPKDSQKDVERKRELLLKYLNARAGQRNARTDEIHRRPEEAAASLSPAQAELWKREHAGAGTAPLYNECVTVRMRGALDVAVLERALNEVIRRHEIWRTVFESRAGDIVGTVLPAAEVRLATLDLRDVPPDEREREARSRVGAELQRSNLFVHGAMVRPLLVRMAHDEYRLYVMAHLMVLDGISAYQIFPTELASLYKAFSAGQPTPLAELTLQFSDFAYWHRAWVNVRADEQIGYWRAQLAGTESAHRDEKAANSFHGVIGNFALPHELGEAIKQMSRQENTTLFLTLLSAFAALIHDRTRKDSVFAGTLSPSGRKRSEFQGLLGYFLNPVALRFEFGSDPTFRQLLGQARKLMSEAMANDDTPMEQVARALRPGAAGGHNPFFSWAISLQPPVPDLGLPWTVTTMDVDSGGSPWDLYLAFIDGSEGLTGRVQYNPERYDAESIDQVLRDYQSAAHALVSQAGLPLSEVFSRSHP